MLAAERRRRILGRLEVAGSVRVAELAELLGAAEETIRRDLERLDAEGRLVRTHGGAILSPDHVGAPPIDPAEADDRPELHAIARAARSFAVEGGAIGLDEGAVCRMLARGLSDSPGTVITNALGVLAALSDHRRVQVVATGGRLDHRRGALVGAVAEHVLDRFQLDVAFLTCTGVHPDRGATATDDALAAVKRRFVELAERVVLLAPAAVFAARGVERFAGIAEIDVVVTDAGAPGEAVERLRAAGCAVTIAEERH